MACRDGPRRAAPLPARRRRPAGGCRASSRAPADSAVVPSTEANTSEVWVTLPTSVRASSTRAPVPEPLSFAPGPGGRSSRPAMNTSASRERPWPVTTPSTLLIGTRAPVGARCAEVLDAHVGSRGAQARGDPGGGCAIPDASGGAIREAVRDLVRRRQRLRAVERRGQRAARERRRGAGADEQHERRQEHDEPARPVGAGPEQRRGSRSAGRTAAHARDARSALARGTLGEHHHRVCMTRRRFRRRRRRPRD